MARSTRVQPFQPQRSQLPRRKPTQKPSYPSKSTCCVKFTMFFMNVLFWIIGCLVIAVASYAIINKQQLYGKITQLTTDPAVILAVAGVLMFVISFAGCLGALRENICFLRFYFVMLGLMLLLEVVAAILGYVYATEVRSQVENAVHHSIKRYRDDPDLQNIVDFLQQELKCCGTTNFRDWEQNIYFNCSSPSVERCGVPFSCCIEDQLNSQCGFGVMKKSNADASKVIYVSGCVVEAEKWLKTNLIMMASIAASLPLLQILGFCFSRKLVSDIKDALNEHRGN